MRRIISPLILVSLLGVSSQAWAFFDAQVLFGMRSAKFDDGTSSDTASGTEINVSTHIDPIPLVPVGFGAYVSMLDYDMDTDGDFQADSMQGSEAGLELMAWLPMVPVITPYAKVSYPLYSVYKYDNAVASVPVIAKSSGPHIGLGVMYSPLPLISLLLQADIANQTMSIEKIDGQDTVDADDFDYSSTAFLIGLRVGI